MDQPARGHKESAPTLGIELARCDTPAPEAEELVLELESKAGARMRVEARNVPAVSLLELVRAFAS